MTGPAGAAGRPRQVVLVGGGHAHVQVLAAHGARPFGDAALTLISREALTPYSGMLPGHVAGAYRRDAIHIDLARLAAATGVRLIAANVIGLDRANRLIWLEGAPPVAYDIASFNLGITPDLDAIAGARRHALPVKPIGGFLARLDRLIDAARRPDGPRRIAIVGAGAAGCELAFCLEHRLRAELAAAGHDPSALTVTLVSAGPPLPSLGAGIRRRVDAALARRGIGLRSGERVTRIDADGCALERGGTIAADAVILATGARAPSFLAATGLPLADDGSIRTRPTLQVVGDDDLFAVGDCARIDASPREKAGVFAVRQGPVLADNLRRRLAGERLAAFKPQSRFLVLLATGDGRAIGGRHGWPSIEGAWVWWWKDRIDRRFVDRFNRLPA